MLFSKFYFLISLLLSTFNNEVKTTFPFSFTAKVIAIKDGDSIDVLYENKKISIRLADIDCPEIRNKQPFGKEAKKYTASLCFGQKVTVQNNNKFDKYKRLIATIINPQNINVNKELIIAGLAWHFKKYSKNNEYELLQQTAKANKKGLWKDATPVAPWEWRK